MDFNWLQDEGLIFRVGSMILVGIGIWGLLTQRNVIKILIALGILETGTNLFLLALFHQQGTLVPILSAQGLVDGAVYADPLPQALVLTSIVIGTAVLALGVALAIRGYQKTGQTHISRLLGGEDL